MRNPFPVVSLWEKDFLGKWTSWVDRQYELCQYPTIKEAMAEILRLTNGRMNPKIIIDIGKLRGLE